jgi:hypothetical protein
LDQTAYQADDAEQPALRVIADAMAREVNGFEPDVIIGYAGQANYLAKLWPAALRLHMSADTSGETLTRSACISIMSAPMGVRRSGASAD